MSFWWNSAIFAIITFQVVLSGVIYPNEDTLKNHQNPTDHSKIDNEFTYTINNQQFIQNDGKNIRYGEITDRILATPIENNESNNNNDYENSNFENGDPFQNITEIIITENNPNDSTEIETQEIIITNDSLNKSSLENNKLNSTNDNKIDDGNNIFVEEFIISNTGQNDKLINDFGLNDENSSDFKIKKHNKREYNYAPPNYQSPPPPMRMPNRQPNPNYGRAPKNPNYPEKGYYRPEKGYYNRGRIPEQDENYDESDDFDGYDGNDDSDDDDDDNDYNDDLSYNHPPLPTPPHHYNDQIYPKNRNNPIYQNNQRRPSYQNIPEVSNQMYEENMEEMKRKYYENERLQHQKLLPQSHYEPNEKVIEAFATFLETVMNQKIKDLEASDQLTDPYENEQVKRQIIDQQNGTVMSTKPPIGYEPINYRDDKIYIDPTKQDPAWRTVRQARSLSMFNNLGIPFLANRNNMDEVSKKMLTAEENFKSKSSNQTPFVLIRCNQKFNDECKKECPETKCETFNTDNTDQNTDNTDDTINNGCVENTETIIIVPEENNETDNCDNDTTDNTCKRENKLEDLNISNEVKSEEEKKQMKRNSEFIYNNDSTNESKNISEGRIKMDNEFNRRNDSNSINASEKKIIRKRKFKPKITGSEITNDENNNGTLHHIMPIKKKSNSTITNEEE